MDVTDIILYGSIGLAIVTIVGAGIWAKIADERRKREERERKRQEALQLEAEKKERDQEAKLERERRLEKEERTRRQESELASISLNTTLNNSQLNQQEQGAHFHPSSSKAPLGDHAPQSYSSQRGVDSVEHSGPPAPRASGSNPSCVNWVNEVLALIYKQHERYSTPLMEALMLALNEKLNAITNASPDYCDLIVEFRSIRQDESSASQLSDIKTELESDKSIIILYNIHQSRLLLELLVLRAPIAGGTTLTSDDPNNQNTNLNQSMEDQATGSNKWLYELAIENLDGSLRSHASLSSKMIVTDYLGRANFKISIESGPKPAESGINEDALISMIAKSISQAMIVYYYGDDPDFPVYRPAQSSGGYRYLDKLSTQLREGAHELGRHLKQRISAQALERKALVKIIRAQNLNLPNELIDQSNLNLTCLLQLDGAFVSSSSSQQMQLTSTKSGSNPHWDEHFIFNLSNDRITHLLIELWDSIQQERPESRNDNQSGGTIKATTFKRQQPQANQKALLTQGARSLGYARITVDQMRSNPMQKVALKLMSPASGEGDGAQQSAGELLIELTYIEHAAGVSRSASSNSISATNNNANNHDLTAHNQSSRPPGEVVRIEPLGSNYEDHENQHKLNSAYLITTERPHSAQSNASAGQQTLASQQELDGQNEETASLKSTELPKPHRVRSRSRSILRALRSRLSFRRSRSTAGSISRPATESPGHGAPSLGGSRSRLSSESSAFINETMHRSGAKTLPGSREPSRSEVPAIVINRDKANALAFNEPKSQLVFECVELVPAARCLNGPSNKSNTLNSNKTRGGDSISTQNLVNQGDQQINQDQNIEPAESELHGQDEDEQPDVVVKYYAIDDKQLAKKWRKKGIKLHFFNDHQFLACHLTSSSACHNCGRVFSRRPGKQGYKCRNCHLLAHKECHTKVEHQCPYSPGPELELEHTNQEPAKGRNLSRSNSIKLLGGRANRSNSTSTFASLRRINNPSTTGFGTTPTATVNPQTTSKVPKLSSKSISLEVENLHNQP